jgi:hypothetical protein
VFFDSEFIVCFHDDNTDEDHEFATQDDPAPRLSAFLSNPKKKSTKSQVPQED